MTILIRTLVLITASWAINQGYASTVLQRLDGLNDQMYAIRTHKIEDELKHVADKASRLIAHTINFNRSATPEERLSAQKSILHKVLGLHAQGKHRFNLKVDHNVQDERYVDHIAWIAVHHLFILNGLTPHKDHKADDGIENIQTLQNFDRLKIKDKNLRTAIAAKIGSFTDNTIYRILGPHFTALYNEFSQHGVSTIKQSSLALWQLPTELLMHMASFMDRKTLNTLGQTNRQFHEMAHDPLWIKPLYINDEDVTQLVQKGVLQPYFSHIQRTSEITVRIDHDRLSANADTIVTAYTVKSEPYQANEFTFTLNSESDKDLRFQCLNNERGDQARIRGERLVIPNNLFLNEVVQTVKARKRIFKDFIPSFRQGDWGMTIKTSTTISTDEFTTFSSCGPIKLKANKLKLQKTLFQTPTGIKIMPDELQNSVITKIEIIPNNFIYNTLQNGIEQSRTSLVTAQIDFTKNIYSLYVLDGHVTVYFNPTIIAALLKKS